MTSLKTAVQNAPVTSLTTVEALVAFILTFLVSHHVLGSIDVSSTSATIAPFVALLLPAVFGTAKWSLVTPWNKTKDALEKTGLLSDADFARLGVLVQDELAHIVAALPAAVPAVLVDAPDGMGAGAPAAVL